MKKTNQIAHIALIVAAYVAMTLSLGDFSVGSIQFRYSEVLNLLAFFNPIYIIALTIGCMISNALLSTPLDVVVGGGTTLVTSILIYKSKSLLIASFWPLLNALTVGWMLAYLYDLPFFATALSIGFSEFIIMTLIAYPLFKQLSKNKGLMKFIRAEKK